MNTRKKNKEREAPESGKTVRCALLFYFNWLDHIEHLPHSEQAEVVMAILHYARTRQQPSQLSEAGWVAFRFSAHIVDHDRERYHLYDPEAEAIETEAPPSLHPQTEQEKTEKENKPHSTHWDKTQAPRTDEDRARDDARDDAGDDAGDAQTPDSQSIARDDARDDALTSQASENERIASPPSPIIKNKEQRTNNNSSSWTAEAAKAQKEEEEKREKTRKRNFAQAASGEEGEEEEEEDGPPTLARLKAYWESEGMESVPEEFFAYYEERQWKNSRKQPVIRWRIAAQRWERYFRDHVKAARARTQALNEAQRMQLEHQRTVESIRQQERAAREAQQQRTEQRACSPEEARALYALALEQCGGVPQQAIEMLKSEHHLQALRQSLARRQSQPQGEEQAAPAEGHRAPRPSTPKPAQGTCTPPTTTAAEPIPPASPHKTSEAAKNPTPQPPPTAPTRPLWAAARQRLATRQGEKPTNPT